MRFELTLLLHTTRFPSEPLQPLEYPSIFGDGRRCRSPCPHGAPSVFETGLRAAAIHPPYIGAEEGIRTHTVMLLRHLPPSVGLPRQRAKENARVLSLAIQFSMSIPPSALCHFRSLGYIPDKYQTIQILLQVYCTLPDLVRILQWLPYYEFYHMGG